jgi:hypothetical protein
VVALMLLASVTLPGIAPYVLVDIVGVAGVLLFVRQAWQALTRRASWASVGVVAILASVASAWVGSATGVTLVRVAPPATSTFAATVPAPDYVPAGPGVVYSYAQLAEALVAAGVPAASANVGAAIAEAESGGRSDAVHLCPPRCDPGQGPERSYGPWQINMIGRSWITPACAMALACAANGASRISGRGTNWTPWSTYGNGRGAYLRYLR